MYYSVYSSSGCVAVPDVIKQNEIFLFIVKLFEILVGRKKKKKRLSSSFEDK